MMEVGRERSANARCLLGRLELAQARHCLQHFKGYPTMGPQTQLNLHDLRDTQRMWCPKTLNQ